jgi:hypothetical protein
LNKEIEMLYSKSKVINTVCDRLVRSGSWELKSDNRHCRLRNVETNQVLTVPFSPSDFRAERNWLSQVRRDYGVM